jgi:hypothetical protein
MGKSWLKNISRNGRRTIGGSFAFCMSKKASYTDGLLVVHGTRGTSLKAKASSLQDDDSKGGGGISSTTLSLVDGVSTLSSVSSISQVERNGSNGRKLAASDGHPLDGEYSWMVDDGASAL